MVNRKAIEIPSKTTAIIHRTLLTGVLRPTRKDSTTGTTDAITPTITVTRTSFPMMIPLSDTTTLVQRFTATKGLRLCDRTKDWSVQRLQFHFNFVIRWFHQKVTVREHNNGNCLTPTYFNGLFPVPSLGVEVFELNS